VQVVVDEQTWINGRGKHRWDVAHIFVPQGIAILGKAHESLTLAHTLTQAGGSFTRLKDRPPSCSEHWCCVGAGKHHKHYQATAAFALTSSPA
jgi:hypothetical protein